MIDHIYAKEHISLLKAKWKNSYPGMFRSLKCVILCMFSNKIQVV